MDQQKTSYYNSFYVFSIISDNIISYEWNDLNFSLNETYKEKFNYDKILYENDCNEELQIENPYFNKTTFVHLFKICNTSYFFNY